jgi:hypothetical protein
MAQLSQELEYRIERQARLLGSFKVECVLIGGVAAALHGSSIPTQDLDVCYARDSANLERLASALRSVQAHLRGAPEDIPFILDAATLHTGLNFTFVTDIGNLDLLGEVRGVGYYEDVVADSEKYELFGYSFPVIDIRKLIIAKRSAGGPKDLMTIVELEAIEERQKIEQSE